MLYIFIYGRVALATAVVQNILEIPANDEILMEDRNHGLAWTKPNNGIYTTQNSLQTCAWRAALKNAKLRRSDDVSLSWPIGVVFGLPAICIIIEMMTWTEIESLQISNYVKKGWITKAIQRAAKDSRFSKCIQLHMCSSLRRQTSNLEI